MEDDAASDTSSVSGHYADVHPELVGTKPPVYTQASHMRSFKRITMSDAVEIEEAYPGAYNAVASLNPEIYKLPHGVSHSLLSAQSSC